MIDFDVLYDTLYSLPAGQSYQMLSQGRLKYKIIKDKDFVQGDENNIVMVILLDEDNGIASTNDIHIHDLNLEDLYEDKLVMYSHATDKEMTGRDYIKQRLEQL